MRRVARVVQFDAEEVQAFADAGANRGAPFSNPAENTSVSRPPSAAANAPTHFFAW